MHEDKIIQKLFEHDKRFDLVAEQMTALKNEVLTRQDETLTILRRLDQERIFTTSWVSRIEKEVEEHRTEITRMKKVLNLA